MTKLELYKCLTKNLTPIKDIRLIYARDESGGIFLSIFYDSSAENYSKTEKEIFDAYTECCSKIQGRHVEILVMIHIESIDIPKGAEILLKRNKHANIRKTERYKRRS